MVSLIGDERGGQQHGDEMTFSNIAGVLPVVDKVSSAQNNTLKQRVENRKAQVETLRNFCLLNHLRLPFAFLGAIRENAFQSHKGQLLRAFLSTQWESCGRDRQPYCEGNNVNCCEMVCTSIDFEDEGTQSKYVGLLLIEGVT